ncbi:hypothetical protein B0H13DRAFT_264407 [Mycena leptocephala]|nr:hypothetical protein B0H13DRAFT_264407 [Mycena leptocephala]
MLTSTRRAARLRRRTPHLGPQARRTGPGYATPSLGTLSQRTPNCLLSRRRPHAPCHAPHSGRRWRRTPPPPSASPVRSPWLALGSTHAPHSAPRTAPPGSTATTALPPAPQLGKHSKRLGKYSPKPLQKQTRGTNEEKNTHFSMLNHARFALYTSTKFVFQTISGVQVASVTEGPVGGVTMEYERREKGEGGGKEEGKGSREEDESRARGQG